MLHGLFVLVLKLFEIRRRVFALGSETFELSLEFAHATRFLRRNFRELRELRFELTELDDEFGLFADERVALIPQLARRASCLFILRLHLRLIFLPHLLELTHLFAQLVDRRVLFF